MGYRGYRPAEPLARLVSVIWLFESDGLPGGHERVLPTGTAELVMDLTGAGLRVFRPGSLTLCERVPGPLVYGPHSEFFVIDRRERTAVLGVHFRPGAAAPLLAIPPDELHNQAVPLELLWGQGAHAFAERVLAAQTPEGRLRAAERELLARLSVGAAAHPAVSWALRAMADRSRPQSVAALTGAVGLSARRFSQVFAQQVGLTPKLYHRVLRFQRALGAAERAEPVAWADVALECGYYDQAHFIHDFRAFAGITPTTYLAQRSPWLNHVTLER